MSIPFFDEKTRSKEKILSKALKSFWITSSCCRCANSGNSSLLGSPVSAIQDQPLLSDLADLCQTCGSPNSQSASPPPVPLLLPSLLTDEHKDDGKIGTDLDDSNLSVLGDAPDQLQANKTIAFKRPTSLPIFQYTELVPRSSRQQAFSLLTLEHYSYHESLVIVNHMASLVHTENLSKDRLAAELSLTMRTMRKNLSPPVAIEAVNFVQRAFCRMENKTLCEEMVKDQGFLRIVGSLHKNRKMLENTQLLTLAKNLLRLRWSLQYSTITDFINACQIKEAEFKTEEVTLFCQCLHNVHLMSTLEENLVETMGQSAVRILEDYVLNEIEDEELSSTLYREKDALTSDLAFDDGRLAVIHVLDAFYRADAELNSFRAIFETCGSELADSQHAKLVSQDVSALLRCFQKFKDQDSSALNKCLGKIADSIHCSIVSDINNVKARDFTKNVKTLTAKYFFSEKLFYVFCTIVERDLEAKCSCKFSDKNICVKSCRFLDFCALADALDAISQIYFIFKNEIYHHQFLAKIENRLCELKTWKSLFTSQVKNKASKIAFVLQHFQTFGYFPKKFISATNNSNENRLAFILTTRNKKVHSQIQSWALYQNTCSFNVALKRSIFANMLKSSRSTQPRSLMTMESQIRSLLFLFFSPPNQIRQEFSPGHNIPFFVINNELAVLPLPRSRFSRDTNGPIASLARLNGRVVPTVRLLRMKYKQRIIFIPHYEFDALKDSQTLRQGTVFRKKNIFL
ncbi:unnamed protein product [Oikopleura dioica]|uniref:Uncharacterized protein n=1 Tax=Oikopleura dioica TaxID=34765 RepID=E4YL55_OIKDI|nr:unnamed protein product [Oikopleura dioica]